MHVFQQQLVVAFAESADDVLLVGSGVEDQVHVAVDESGQDRSAGEPSNLGIGVLKKFVGGPDRGDGAVAHEHASVNDGLPSGAWQNPVGGKKGVGHPWFPFCGSVGTSSWRATARDSRTNWRASLVITEVRVSVSSGRWSATIAG